MKISFLLFFGFLLGCQTTNLSSENEEENDQEEIPIGDPIEEYSPPKSHNPCAEFQVIILNDFNQEHEILIPVFCDSKYLDQGDPEPKYKDPISEKYTNSNYI